ncbi:MAG TPA: tRNA 2-selenouridine(34) synthase MnmH [Verrucomicrobiales bacterium]|nr:tRNA 2-selenouridine(34) synthase MnmH [Verrucomicrobiales bacterium]
MRYLNWSECMAQKPFTRIIDVRSPAEYAENHIPGAVNLPVLTNDERAEVGRLYHQVSRFDARRLGAAMVARNTAAHLETFFTPHPEHSRFLLYCWRGGQRSRAMALILHAVGWDVTVIAGGYKNYRAHVRESLTHLCPQLRCHMLTGLTGSGKTQLLRRMAAGGHQVLDLEGLGEHRGSLLGDEPDRPQPSQKHFESLLLEKIERFDLTKPVWVESESKRLGRLWLPEPLWQAMLSSTVHEISVPAEQRADYLIREYPHFTAAPDALLGKLQTLKEACGGKQLTVWHDMIRAGQWREFVISILDRHYDPVYRRCQDFPAPSSHHSLSSVSAESVAEAAEELGRQAS